VTPAGPGHGGEPPAWSAVAAAGYPYLFAVILDSPAADTIGRACDGLALLAVVVAASRRFPFDRR